MRWRERRPAGPLLSGRTPAGLELTLRPMTKGDEAPLAALRRRSAEWLRPWEPTPPPGEAMWALPERDPTRYRRAVEAGAQAGGSLTLLVVAGGELVGQVGASSIVEGAARSCSVGYWVAPEHAGRWIAPTAVAVLVDHLLSPGGRRLHRVEVAVRPENAASLAVVAKLGLREEGLRRAWLHIDGGWRDHRVFTVLADELGPGGLQARLSRAYHPPHPRHTG